MIGGCLEGVWGGGGGGVWVVFVGFNVGFDRAKKTRKCDMEFDSDTLSKKHAQNK